MWQDKFVTSSQKFHDDDVQLRVSHTWHIYKNTVRKLQVGYSGIKTESACMLPDEFLLGLVGVLAAQEWWSDRPFRFTCTVVDTSA